MSNLGGQYHAVRERLKNGYGSRIPDLPIVLNTKPHHDPLNELRKRLDKMEAEVANLKFKLAQQAPKPFPVSPCERILRAIAKNEGLTKTELIAHRKGKVIVMTRQMGFYLCATMTNASLPAIGAVWHRDHSTVMHGRDKIARLRKVRPQLDNLISWYEKHLVDCVHSVNNSVESAPVF